MHSEVLRSSAPRVHPLGIILQAPMTPIPPDCAKCHALMEIGVVFDRGHGNALNRSEWVEGEAERSFWRGFKTKGKEKYPISSYRCPRCGYLELYAHPEAVE